MLFGSGAVGGNDLLGQAQRLDGLGNLVVEQVLADVFAENVHAVPEPVVPPPDQRGRIVHIAEIQPAEKARAGVFLGRDPPFGHAGVHQLVQRGELPQRVYAVIGGIALLQRLQLLPVGVGEKAVVAVGGAHNARAPAAAARKNSGTPSWPWKPG